jgi:exosome complex component RRP45
VLNHEGSVADCASIAGLAALAHFRRPDVTLQGDVVQVHIHQSLIASS